MPISRLDKLELILLEGELERVLGVVEVVEQQVVAKHAQVRPAKPCGAILEGFRNQLVADDRMALGVVGIQHPGGSWPDNSGKPRSAVIAIWREDGQTIG